MDSLKRRARGAGAFSFAFMIVAILGEFFSPASQVPGDAVATARNVTHGEETYRPAHVPGSVTSRVLPDYRQAASRVLMPLHFGEMPIVFWLPIMGSRGPRAWDEASTACCKRWGGSVCRPVGPPCDGHDERASFRIGVRGELLHIAADVAIAGAASS